MTFLISILGIDNVQQPIFNVYGSGGGKRFQIHIIKIYIYCFRSHIMKYMLSLQFASSLMDCYFVTSSTTTQQIVLDFYSKIVRFTVVILLEGGHNGPIYAKFSECCINIYPSKIAAIGEF